MSSRDESNRLEPLKVLKDPVVLGDIGKPGLAKCRHNPKSQAQHCENASSHGFNIATIPTMGGPHLLVREDQNALKSLAGSQTARSSVIAGLRFLNVQTQHYSVHELNDRPGLEPPWHMWFHVRLGGRRGKPAGIQLTGSTDRPFTANPVSVCVISPVVP